MAQTYAFWAAVGSLFSGTSRLFAAKLLIHHLMKSTQPHFLTSEEKSNFGEKNHKWHIFLPLRFQVLASVRHKIEQFAAAEQSFPLLLAEAQQYLLARMGSPSRELPGVLTKGNKQVTCKQIRSLNDWIKIREETFVYMEYYFTMFLH